MHSLAPAVGSHGIQPHPLTCADHDHVTYPHPTLRGCGRRTWRAAAARFRDLTVDWWPAATADPPRSSKPAAAWDLRPCREGVATTRLRLTPKLEFMPRLSVRPGARPLEDA